MRHHEETQYHQELEEYCKKHHVKSGDTRITREYKQTLRNGTVIVVHNVKTTLLKLRQDDGTERWEEVYDLANCRKIEDAITAKYPHYYDATNPNHKKLSVYIVESETWQVKGKTLHHGNRVCVIAEGHGASQITQQYWEQPCWVETTELEKHCRRKQTIHHKKQ